MHEIEKIIDEMAARAHPQGGDRNEMRALLRRPVIELRAILRRRVIEAVVFQFKEGLELSDLGATLPPENMIGLIANYTESGEAGTKA
jgi:hypothetical protein